MRDVVIYLQDIIDAMLAIERFVGDLGFNEFKNDDMVSSAVIRKFEIIGEATKQIPEDIRNAYPDVQWKEMAGMRDRLIHFYFGVKYELVWHTIKDVIPLLKPIINKIITDIKTDN